MDEDEAQSQQLQAFFPFSPHGTDVIQVGASQANTLDKPQRRGLRLLALGMILSIPLRRAPISDHLVFIQMVVVYEDCLNWSSSARL